MRYEIIFTREAREDLLALSGYDRKKILDAIEIHLRYEPERIGKSRIKRLQGIESPQYRLRIDEIRAFYDVVYLTDEHRVDILAIKEKAGAMRWLALHGRRNE